MRYFLFTLFILTLSACQSVNVKEYEDNTPKFDLNEYFAGETVGYGIFQNFSGKLEKQFVVHITGTTNDKGALVLEENFDWSDGTESVRIWTLDKKNAHEYIGTATDVIGEAKGEAYGNVLHWNYDVDMEYEGDQWELHFDDWMFLQPDGVLLNRAKITKFGFEVGQVTISFHKK